MHARNRAAKAKHCKVTKGKGRDKHRIAMAKYGDDLISKGKEEKCTATAKTSKATSGNDVKAKA